MLGFAFGAVFYLINISGPDSFACRRSVAGHARPDVLQLRHPGHPRLWRHHSPKQCRPLPGRPRGVDRNDLHRRLHGAPGLPRGLHPRLRVNYIAPSRPGILTGKALGIMVTANLRKLAALTVVTLRSPPEPREHGLSQKAVEIARPFGFPITNSMVVTWVVAAGPDSFARIATRDMKRVPDGASELSGVAGRRSVRLPRGNHRSPPGQADVLVLRLHLHLHSRRELDRPHPGRRHDRLGPSDRRWLHIDHRSSAAPTPTST